ncbi:MAG: acyl-CoA thioesterase [Bacteroidota bacterium]|nr:acyl-CoA thioesterase [Bacteroidota bacterium]
MIITEVQIRVRYGETDRMGFVYYGNYATYLEVARVEALRQIGVSYLEMENGGVSLPVLEYKIKYLKPAFYDDLLTIKTTIRELPGIRIKFEYETYNQNEILLNISETTLVFVNVKTLKPCMAPAFVLEKMQPNF